MCQPCYTDILQTSVLNGYVQFDVLILNINVCDKVNETRM